MKSIKLSFLGLILSIAWLNAQAPFFKTGLVADDLTGNVKQVNLETFKAEKKGDAVTKGEKDYNSLNNYFTTYKTNGKWATKIQYIPKNGEVTFTYKYDKAGNLLEQTEKSNNTPLDYKATWKYNDKGYPIEEVRYHKNVLDFKYTYKYNDKNQLIEAKFWSETDELLNIDTWKYDDKGNYIEWISLNYDNTQFGRATYMYDSNNRMIESAGIDKDGKRSSVETYVWNDKGHLTRSIDKKLTYTMTRKTEMIYTYDSHSNWITCIVILDDKPHKYITRTIEYY